MHMVSGGANGKQELLYYDKKLALYTTKRKEQSEGKTGKRGCGVQIITASFFKE